jgi:E-phenylitaconyl-CoA hydratase
VSIEFEVDAEGVALVTIDRPERLNAMDAEHYEQLSQAWQRVRDEEAIRAAVVTGAGERAFSVGADLKTFIGSPPPLADNWLTQRGQLLNRGLEVWKPVVSAVNGLCLGGGTTLLFATDLRVAVEEASFGLPEVKRGVLPGNGGTQRALTQLPHAIAMEMLLTGASLSAERAAHFGLVNRVVAREELLPTAIGLARETAANAPLAVQAAKELALRSRDMDLASGLRLEQSWLRMLQETEDVAEGRRAFAEKRPPRFQGR